MKAMLACVIVACALLPMLARAQACEPTATESVRNRDGSRLSVTTTCRSEEMRTFVIELQCTDGRICDRLEVEQGVDDAPKERVYLVDLLDNGMPLVEIRGMCGTGPNCEGNLYGVSADGRSLTHFFSGGYSDLSVQDGWLVESGRASCCSWEFHLWKLDDLPALPLQYDNMQLMAEVGVIFAEDGVEGQFDCRFIRPDGDSGRIVAPPSATLQELCTVYGENYILAPPGPLPDPMPDPGADGRMPEH